MAERVVNLYGETFEDPPPPGEYWLCPLRECRYKLLVATAFDLSEPMGSQIVDGIDVRTWVGVTPSSLSDMVRDRLMRHTATCDRLMREHLKGHEPMDFYRTHAAIMEEAKAKADKIQRLADLVFLATATQEQTKDGG
jgi:hypothetical protein